MNPLYNYRHYFEPSFYLMWLSTQMLLFGLLYVAVKHL